MRYSAATFGWLCVETLEYCILSWYLYLQPPSGGCVLKPTGVWFDIISLLAATFGWLCVETFSF